MFVVLDISDAVTECPDDVRMSAEERRDWRTGEDGRHVVPTVGKLLCLPPPIHYVSGLILGGEHDRPGDAEPPV